MTVFEQFRLWARRAPVGERAGALVGAALVVAVLGWVLVPPGDQASDVVVGGDQGTGNVVVGADRGTEAAASGQIADPATGAAPAASGGSEASGGASATTAGASSSGGDGSAVSASDGGGTGEGACVSPPGSDAGVTDSEIKIAIILMNLVGPAGNNTFGLPPADTQRSYFEAVIDSINASGGVACRELVPDFYAANPADQSQMQQTCQEVVAAQPFFVIDVGAYSVFQELAACYLTNRMPLMMNWASASLQQEFYPYLFSRRLDQVLYKNTVFGLKERGFFEAANGFRKLGFIYRDCTPELGPEFVGYLHEVGLSDSQIVAYNLGCPTGFVAPSTHQQAILTFQQQGVTHMSVVNAAADFANFTIIAQQQGFRPKWGLADNAIVLEDYGVLRPDFENIANAVAITGGSFGEAKTPGYPVSNGTARCNAIFEAAGEPPVYEQQAGAGGSACSQLWILKAAVEHAPSLQRAALAEGLVAAGSVEMSYPWGPNDFRPNSVTGSRVTYGEQHWRAVQLVPSCECWQVVDPDWHPAFQ